VTGENMMPIFKARKLMLTAMLVVACLVGETVRAQQPSSADQKSKLTEPEMKAKILASAEWKQAGPPLEIADGSALAETCARHGVGVLSATVNVDFVDADFFSELVEG